MPELPEVEVTRRGIHPHVVGQTTSSVVVRNRALRWPIPAGLEDKLTAQRVLDTARRGKYLMLAFSHGTVLFHLGMSGHLRIVPYDTPVGKHDHFDLQFGDWILRLCDPRRFGAVLWHDAALGPVESHALLKMLGMEPFDPRFDGAFLYQRTRNRSLAIKHLLLAGDVVVGAGNIYACEALFKAGIHPATPAQAISQIRYAALAMHIRETLAQAIELGGSSLRDYVQVNGASGRVQLGYFVYGRAGESCKRCATPIALIRQGQRSTFYCPQCQRD